MPVEQASIILPFLKSGHFLREAVESVLAQRDYDAWHLYLINDGSDKADVDIARHYCDLYPTQVTLLAHDSTAWRGTSASRNLGIRKSKGEFIAFIDADDTWYPDKLNHQVRDLERCVAADMIYGAALRWRSWNGGIDFHVPAAVDGFGSDCLVPGSALLTTYLRDESQTPCTGSVLVRSAAVRRVGGFEEQFCGLYDDQVFYAKLCRSSQILVSSECVSRYRQHSQSCCRQAEADDAGEKERRRFLDWLGRYQERACA